MIKIGCQPQDYTPDEQARMDATLRAVSGVSVDRAGMYAVDAVVLYCLATYGDHCRGPNDRPPHKCCNLTWPRFIRARKRLERRGLVTVEETEHGERFIIHREQVAKLPLAPWADGQEATGTDD